MLHTSKIYYFSCAGYKLSKESHSLREAAALYSGGSLFAFSSFFFIKETAVCVLCETGHGNTSGLLF